MNNLALSFPHPIAPVQPGSREHELEIISEFLKEKQAEEPPSSSSSVPAVHGYQSYHVGYAVAPDGEASASVDELEALLSAVRLTSIDDTAAQTQGN